MAHSSSSLKGRSIIGLCRSIIGLLLMLLVTGCCFSGDGWHENVYVPVMSRAGSIEE